MKRPHLLSGLIAALVLGGLAALVLIPRPAEARLQGDLLSGRVAPDFRLIDQWGRPVHLSALRGRVVVLTFIEARCTNVCPMVAEKIRRTVADLGTDASRVVVLAISTDPAGDSPGAVRTFSQEHHLYHTWHYLAAPGKRLPSIWRSYYIYAAPPTSATADVAHTSATYVLDTHGRERVLLVGDIDATALERDIRVLAGLPLPAVSGVGPQMGQLAPDFVLRAAGGAPSRLSSYRGKVVLLNFWATWCGPCRSEMPRLESWYRTERSRGFVVLGVDQQESAADVESYARRVGAGYPLLLDSGGSVSAEYNVTGLPTSILLNRSGAVTREFLGPLSSADLTKYVLPILH